MKFTNKLLFLTFLLVLFTFTNSAKLTTERKHHKHRSNTKLDGYESDSDAFYKIVKIGQSPVKEDPKMFYDLSTTEGAADSYVLNLGVCVDGEKEELAPFFKHNHANFDVTFDGCLFKTLRKYQIPTINIKSLHHDEEHKWTTVTIERKMTNPDQHLKIEFHIADKHIAVANNLKERVNKVRRLVTSQTEKYFIEFYKNKFAKLRYGRRASVTDLDTEMLSSFLVDFKKGSALEAFRRDYISTFNRHVGSEYFLTELSKLTNFNLIEDSYLRKTVHEYPELEVELHKYLSELGTNKPEPPAGGGPYYLSPSDHTAYSITTGESTKSKKITLYYKAQYVDEPYHSVADKHLMQIVVCGYKDSDPLKPYYEGSKLNIAGMCKETDAPYLYHIPLIHIRSFSDSSPFAVTIYRHAGDIGSGHGLGLSFIIEKSNKETAHILKKNRIEDRKLVFDKLVAEHRAYNNAIKLDKNLMNGLKTHQNENKERMKKEFLPEFKSAYLNEFRSNLKEIITEITATADVVMHLRDELSIDLTAFRPDWH